MAETQQFKYEARNQSTSKFVEGTIKAANKAAVAEYLVNNGYIPLNIAPLTALQKDIKIGSKTVKPKIVAQFMRQFATLNNAGIPITKALDVLRDQAQNPNFKATLAAIRKDIDTGATLANAMSKHPIVFTPLSVSMIRAGEAGGFLTETLVTVAESMEADVKLRSKIKSAMTYPIAVLALAAILVVAMLLFIIPIFSGLFESLGGELPVATQLLVDASAFIQVGGIPLALVIAGIIFWWNRNKHKENIRRFVDPIKIKIPIFGKLSQKIIIARFTQNFGALLGAGLPVMQVMDIVGSTSGSTVLEDALEEAKKGVAQGELIAPQLAKHKIFPQMLTEMMAVGEDAGEIPLMMEKISKTYNEEVDTMTESLTSLMEPLMLIVLGAVVGGMVIAMYLPIFSIQDLIA